MKRKISLSTSDIENLVDELKRYEKSLQEKCYMLTSRLSKVGIEVVKMEYRSGAADPTTNKDFKVWYEPETDKLRGKLVVQGEDILFIEFGAGITFNKNEHPKAAEMGYGVGTYPGQTHAFDADGWWYRKDGKAYHSFGTEATMPVYKAAWAMSEEVERIAKEVFGSD